MIWPPPSYPHTSSFGKHYHAAYGKPWSPSPHPIALYDTSLWPLLPRKTYQPLIEWGRANLRCHAMSGPALSVNDHHVENLHRYVSGRTTRSQFTWDIMWQEIAEGRGELIDTFFEGNHIGSTVFIDGDDCSIYWTGAYDREFFIHGPISHYPLYLAIGNAGLREKRWVELGEMPTQPLSTETSIQRTKEYNIGFFKRGFATHVAKDGKIEQIRPISTLPKEPPVDSRMTLWGPWEHPLA